MEESLKGFIGNIRMGDIQVHDNLAIIPLFMEGNGSPSYITLKEALESGILIVTEIDPAPPATGKFLKGITSCRQTKHPSVGLGHDLRFEGKKAVGTALVLEDTVIHMAFFAVTESDKAGRMAGMKQRRHSRIRY